MKINTKDFLLMLLSIAGDNIESETRIQKLAFLGIKEEGLREFTHFEWDRYGPLSKELWRTLRTMEKQGLLNIREENRFTFMGDSYMIRVFTLTSKGTKESSMQREIHGDEFTLIKKLYLMYGSEPLDSLLNYVHTAYSPEDL